MKITEKIINNRFKLSAVLIILLGIIGFFINELSIQDWILTTNELFCIWWNIKFFGLILASYELFMLITNNNKKLSFIGTIVLVFSGTVLWNLNNIDSLVIGEILVLLVNYFFQKDKMKEKIIVSVGIIVFTIFYMFTFRPYAVGFGYVFLGLMIWILINNKDKIKQDKKVIILEVGTIVLSILGALLATIFFNNNNIEYSNINSNGISILFSYLYSVLLPFNSFEGAELFTSTISIFPFPIFLALYYLYKKEDHIEFLLPMSVVIVFEIVYCISGFPDIINKITLFSETNALRVMASVQIASLFVIFYFIGNVKEELFKIKHSMRITIIFACILIFIGFPTKFSTLKYLYLFVSQISLLGFLFLNFGDKKYQKVLLFFLVLITLISGIPIIFIL